MECGSCERLRTCGGLLNEMDFRIIVASLLCDAFGPDGTFAPGGGGTGGGVTPFAAMHEHSYIAVTDATSVVLPAYADRQGGWVLNTSDSDVRIAFNAVAGLTEPSIVHPGGRILLPPGYIGPVSAIHAFAGLTKIIEVADW